MIVCQSDLRVGDCVCEIPCSSEEDAGKRWRIEGFESDGEVAMCWLLSYTRDERRPIPTGHLMLISRDVRPATEAARDSREPAPGPPPLLVISRNRMTTAAITHLEAVVARAGAGKSVFFDGGLDVFQLIDGRWQPLGPRP